jgi:hypothetical protein
MLVEALIRIPIGDRALALEAAESIEEAYARAKSLELVFHAASPGEAGWVARAVREQAARPANQRSPAVLAGLAAGAAGVDHDLGIELIRPAVDRLQKPDGGDRMEDADYVYQILASVDPTRAEGELARGLAMRDGDTADRLLAFARGTAHDRPSLAWRAIAAATGRNGRHVREKARLIRQVAGRLPAGWRRGHRRSACRTGRARWSVSLCAIRA